MDRTAGVISLRRLITDLRGKWALFTRENYVCHDGLPYDYEAVMLKEFADRIGTGPFWAAELWGRLRQHGDGNSTDTGATSPSLRLNPPPSFGASMIRPLPA